MILHTVAGDKLLLKFQWPQWALHHGRQAARYAVERGQVLRAMTRGDRAPEGWFEEHGQRMLGFYPLKIIKEIVPMTDAEKQIDPEALYVRDKDEPMHNEVVPGANTVTLTTAVLKAGKPGAKERAEAVSAHIEKQIEDHIGAPVNIVVVDG